MQALVGDTWSIILSPGRVWHEPTDGDWSRGAFPFTLAATSGVGQHYGVATFLFNNQSVSQLRIQIAQESANWAQYNIWGQTAVTFSAGTVEDAQRELEKFALNKLTQLDVRPWSELADKYWRSLESFDGTGNRYNIAVSGLMVDDIFYLRPCRTRAGAHPYCREMRYAVFSVSTSLGTALSLLWLAQQYGPEVLDEKITDYISIPAQHDGWTSVTFANALNMATGIGDELPEPVNYYVETDKGLIASRVRKAKSLDEKLHAMATSDQYPWGPGKIIRYRSADTIALIAAMDAYLKSKEGADADLWNSVNQHVLTALGIDQIPIKRTLEANGTLGTPLLDSGMFVTIEDTLKIARLFQDHGQFNGQQLLHRGLTQRAMSTNMNRGLPNGWHYKEGGQAHYESSFTLIPFEHWFGCRIRIPTMVGQGGNYVSIMPNRTIGLRFADGHDNNPGTWDSFDIRKISDRIRPFCP